MGAVKLNCSNYILRALFTFLWLFLLALPGVSVAQPPSESEVSEAPQEGGSVMRSFTEREQELGEAVKIADKTKHRILFFMGVTLLVLILITAGLGIRMAFYGHQLFIPHMLFAGSSVFLSIAHAVTAIVWFFPF